MIQVYPEYIIFSMFVTFFKETCYLFTFMLLVPPMYLFLLVPMYLCILMIHR